MLTRRRVIAAAPLAAFAAALPRAAAAPPAPIRFGLITDVHHDVMPDAVDRVTAFADAMTKLKADFVCQLGDFCWPKPANRPCLAALERFKGDRYHVLGNHDMDGGLTREKAVAFFGMPGRYYSFDKAGVRFVVLDGNDPGGKAAGYKRFIAKDQLDWLTKELAAAAGPVVVLVHQPFDDHPLGIENHEAVRAVLKAANADGPKVAAVFSGHHHENYARTIDEILHVQINSASYFWMGGKYAHKSYDAETHKRYPYLESTCPYKDPLWAVVTIDRAAGTITVEGKATEWVGGSPWDVGATEATHDTKAIQPKISPREHALKVKP